MTDCVLGTSGSIANPQYVTENLQRCIVNPQLKALSGLQLDTTAEHSHHEGVAQLVNGQGIWGDERHCVLVNIAIGIEGLNVKVWIGHDSSVEHLEAAVNRSKVAILRAICVF